MRLALAALALCALALPAVPDVAPPADEITVRVDKRGATIVIDVEMLVQVSALEAWAVLTDYDHMAAFVSNLKSSVVRSRKANTLVVEQTGEARRGPVAFAFETVRAVELEPHREIRSKLVAGEFKSYTFSTRIVDRGTSAFIVNHGEYEPTHWVPPVIGPAMIEEETRKQYAELRDEMLRRQRAPQAAPR